MPISHGFIFEILSKQRVARLVHPFRMESAPDDWTEKGSSCLEDPLAWNIANHTRGALREEWPGSPHRLTPRPSQVVEEELEPPKRPGV